MRSVVEKAAGPRPAVGAGTVGDLCTRPAETVSAGASVREAAERMAAREVGLLVVTNPFREAEGVLTDRDVVLRCVAKGLDVDGTPVSRIMTHGVCSVTAGTRIETALEFMSDEEVRRLVVVDEGGSVVGVLSLGDVLR
ncbi:MAG: hypothetical protein AMS19_09205 [Gemmatimonas sp. SG8_23]|jgi:CBS domain-containing protein|nr:MAG: hypothetical protein AMS19_09205 [Gemmatimonas sp. SG8_23]